MKNRLRIFEAQIDQNLKNHITRLRSDLCVPNGVDSCTNLFLSYSV